MGNRIYVVRLSEQERTDLQGMVKTGKVAAFKRQRAQILLNVDRGKHGPSLLNTAVARMFDISIKTVERAKSYPWNRASRNVTTRNMSVIAPVTSLYFSNHYAAGGALMSQHG